jgi:dienelactone hydrolase
MATSRLEKVRLTAADGGALRVDVRTAARPGAARPAVIVCHGFKGFKDWGFFPKLAERLAFGGFTAVTFNFSGSGVGEGEAFDELDRWGRQRPTTDLEDLRIVTEFVVGHGARWVGIVGHSRGGGLGILHAARDERIRALVTWAAVDHFLRWPEEDISRWRSEGKIGVVNARTGQVLTLFRDALEDCDAHAATALNIPAAAQRIRAPWLIVHGTGDEAVPVSVAERHQAAASSVHPELMLVEGAGHTFGIRHPWAGSTPDFDAVQERTVRFLATALG